MKATKFPNEVYVQRMIETNGEEYLLLSETAEDASEADLCKAEPGTSVAVYKLDRVVRLIRDVSVTEAPIRRGR